MFRKKRVLMLCIIIILLCGFTSVCFAISGFRLPQLFASHQNLNTADAVFERNGEILYYDSERDSINVLSTEGKYNPLLSPDNGQILYRRSVIDSQDHALVFGAMDLKGNTIFEIIIDTEFSNDILDLTWISESLVGITTHINPSSSEYFVYDICEQKLLKRFVGSSFSVIPGTNHVMYEKNVPYWSDESVQHSFLIDDNLVFVSENTNTKLSTPVFSPDMTQVAFIETPVNVDHDSTEKLQEANLIICEFNLNNLSLHKKNSIVLDSEISGYLAFNEKNDVCIVNTNVYYYYNKETDSFIAEKSSTNLRDNSTDSLTYEKLQKAISALYGDVDLSMIHSINWITK